MHWFDLLLNEPLTSKQTYHKYCIICFLGANDVYEYMIILNNMEVDPLNFFVTQIISKCSNKKC